MRVIIEHKLFKSLNPPDSQMYMDMTSVLDCGGGRNLRGGDLGKSG